MGYYISGSVPHPIVISDPEGARKALLTAGQNNVFGTSAFMRGRNNFIVEETREPGSLPRFLELVGFTGIASGSPQDVVSLSGFEGKTYIEDWVLKTIAPFTSPGVVFTMEFVGDDGAFWKVALESGQAVRYEGVKEYMSMGTVL